MKNIGAEKIINRHFQYISSFILLAWAITGIVIGWLFRLDGSDFMQFESDAGVFFESASSGLLDVEPNILYFLTHENLLPMAIWNFIYSSLKLISINPDPIYGIIANTCTMVLSNFLIVRYSRNVLGTSGRQSLLQANLLGGFGVFLMFGGIHLRDCFAVLLMTVSAIFFNRGIVDKQGLSKRLMMLLVLMVVGFLTRTEMVVIALLGFTSQIFLNAKKSFFDAFQFIFPLLLAIIMYGAIFNIVSEQYQAYMALSKAESGSSSLAYSALYEAPLLISTILSAFLVLFIKFPFFAGIFSDSYAFFLSIGAFQMIFFIPYFFYKVVQVIASTGELRDRYLHFVLIIFGLLLAVSLTSMQARHFFVAYPLMVLVAVPNNKIYIVYKSRSLIRALCILLGLFAVILNVLSSWLKLI